jgi:hypothetical protein
VCWSIVPLNLALGATFVLSTAANAPKWSLYFVYLLLCVMQIAAGVVTAATSARRRTFEQRTTETEPDRGRFTLGVIGTILGIIELLVGLCGMLGLAGA